MIVFSQVTVPMAAWVGSGRIVTVPIPKANFGAHFGAHGGRPDLSRMGGSRQPVDSAVDGIEHGREVALNGAAHDPRLDEEVAVRDAVAHPHIWFHTEPKSASRSAASSPDSASIPADSRMQIASTVFWSDRSPVP